jgi:hypothetical protein
MLDPQELFDVGLLRATCSAISSFWRPVRGFTCSNQPSMAGSLPSSDTSVDSALTMCHTALSSSAMYECHPCNCDRSGVPRP